MTEDKARTKWCPQVARLSNNGNGSWNRAKDGAMGIGTRCIASDCMMWKWNFKYINDEIEAVEETGHCGLAK